MYDYYTLLNLDIWIKEGSDSSFKFLRTEYTVTRQDTIEMQHQTTVFNIIET